MSVIEKIYIVHYTKLTERVEEMKKRFDKILPRDWRSTDLVTFITPFDGDKITKDQILCLVPEAQNASLRTARPSRGTVSVTTKHHLAYYDMLKHGYSAAMITEDDVDFLDRFSEKLTIVLDNLKKQAWSNCFFSGCMGNRAVMCRGKLSQNFSFGMNYHCWILIIYN